MTIFTPQIMRKDSLVTRVEAVEEKLNEVHSTACAPQSRLGWGSPLCGNVAQNQQKPLVLQRPSQEVSKKKPCIVLEGLWGNPG